jgi:hypothetical protein
MVVTAAMEASVVLEMIAAKIMVVRVFKINDDR